MNKQQDVTLRSQDSIYFKTLRSYFENIKDYVKDIDIQVKVEEETHTFFFNKKNEIKNKKSNGDFCGQCRITLYLKEKIFKCKKIVEFLKHFDSKQLN